MMANWAADALRYFCYLETTIVMNSGQYFFSLGFLFFRLDVSLSLGSPALTSTWAYYLDTHIKKSEQHRLSFKEKQWWKNGTLLWGHSWNTGIQRRWTLTFFFTLYTFVRYKKGDRVIGVLTNAHRVSLECLDRPVLSELTDVDAHICAARGEGVVALPVHVQGRSCREETRSQSGDLQLDQCGERWKNTNLSGRGTAAWLLPCGRPRWLLSTRG